MKPLAPSFASAVAPHFAILCSLIILLLHGAYASYYVFEAYQYALQVSVDSVLLTYIYRLLGLGSVTHRDKYMVLTVTDACIAFWHSTGLLRALRASLRFRRLLLDVPEEKIAANIVAKLKSLATKTGVEGSTVSLSSERHGRCGCWSQQLSRLGDKFKSIKREYFTMDGQHFETGTNVRKSVEIATQINLVLRMSRTISEQRINDLVVSIFTLNCVATPLMRFASRNSADRIRSRVTRHIMGMLLAICFTVAVPMSIWGYALPLIGVDAILFDQLMSTRVRYLARHVFVSEWSQVFSTRVAALAAILAFEAVKRKLVASLQGHSTKRILAVTDLVAAATAAQEAQATDSKNDATDQPPLIKRRRWSVAGAFDILWVVAGLVVVVLHIQARNRTPLPVGLKCEMPMHPWMEPRVACAVLEINCYRGGISGSADEIDRVLKGIEVSVLSALRFTHCPALTMPKRLQLLNNLAVLELYNSSIVAWTVDAALTTRDHPYLGSLWLVNVSGIASLPLGLQDPTFPTADVIISRSDLADLPANLADNWPHLMSKLAIEHSRLTTFPEALFSISAFAFSLAGNNITSIPETAWNGKFFTYLCIAENPRLQKLPDAGWFASLVDVQRTNVSVTPPWMSASSSSTLFAGSSPLCASPGVSANQWISCASSNDYTTGLFPMAFIRSQRKP